MNSALFGLVAAVAWGLNDFLARFPSRAVGPIPTVLVVTGAGLVALSAWLLLGDVAITIVWPSIWLAALSGVCFALGTLALYAALASGPITIVAPIAGSFPAPAMIFAVVQGARPSLAQWLAVAAVMAGVAVMSRSGAHYETSGVLQPGKLKSVLGLAVLASLLFAVSLASGQHAAPVIGEVETVWLARAFGFVAIGAIYLWRSPSLKLPMRWLPLLGVMGCLDVAALGIIVAAGRLSDPAFATVASSAFSAITVILARVILRETISLAQLGGMALIFGGVGVLAGL